MRQWSWVLLAAVACPAASAAEGTVSLIKMPYRGERNLPDLSDSPDYLEKGGIAALVEREGFRVRPMATVTLSAEEQKAYGEWNRLGLANGRLARIVADEIKAGSVPVGLLANCSALMAGSVPIHYAQRGSGEPVVLLHGRGGHADFSRMVREFLDTHSAARSRESPSRR